MKLLIRDSKGSTNPINIMESDYVKDLRDQIRIKNNITGDIELIFNGTILDDSKRLLEYQISEGNTIDYLGQFNAGLNIKI